jgi:hypothetical protein
MSRVTAIGLAVSALLSGCETPVTSRYAILADNNMAIKALGVGGIGIGPFTGPSNFSPVCRLYGPLKISDDLTHTQYIQRAFEEEFKIAGAFEQFSPRVTLTGQISRLEFSSIGSDPDSGATIPRGSWTINLNLISSNGNTMEVLEFYEFPSGILAVEACRQTADAFSRAVQNLVGKAIRSPDFSGLIR